MIPRSLSAAVLLLAPVLAAEPVQLSGIYPHLAMFNPHGECGTGGVVPYGDRLWVITYGPHYPKGSEDKLYSIDRNLTRVIHPESIGGTPANRMIHPESQQLFLGPYAISSSNEVRAIPYDMMPGRHTGNARHLFDPAGKIYFATMEEGFYEVDVKTLEVTELFADDQKQIGDSSAGSAPGDRRLARLPGYHGKGFYSGQGVLVYANNGEASSDARQRPDIPSGCLAEWDGKAAKWTVVRRCQFTEVTGPGGITGNPNPATDPIWATGWDTKSVILALREPGNGWTFYRLPKASHSYDGSHGWNTEWPRIREIGENDLLMTMHGTFWRFPKTFSSHNSAGIAPRSNFLKVVGDFCRWGDRLVIGCDDVAQKEFLNTRKAKGKLAPSQSQSNLWFISPGTLDHLGPAIGRGSVWENENVPAGTTSDPYLFSGYDLRALHLSHRSRKPVSFTIEVDRKGTGEWTTLKEVTAGSYLHLAFSSEEKGSWIRLKPASDAIGLTAAFTYRNSDKRRSEPDPIFDGLASSGQSLTGGLVRARDKDTRTLSFAALDSEGNDLGYYELDESLVLKPVDDPETFEWTKKNTAIPTDVLTIDEASVLYIEDDGKRWRLPKGDLPAHPLGDYRIDREIVTERDLFNADGTFYELPSINAGGFAKVRPVATHNRHIHDYAGYRGLLFISGLATDLPTDNEHLIESTDGKTALWAGTIDDLWKLGKPRGHGGPWKNTRVKAGQPSDPYLMTAYDEKILQLRFDDPANDSLKVTAQVDITGNDDWVNYETFHLENGHVTGHTFPESFSAYWIRFVADEDTTATAELIYR